MLEGQSRAITQENLQVVDDDNLDQVKHRNVMSMVCFTSEMKARQRFLPLA